MWPTVATARSSTANFDAVGAAGCAQIEMVAMDMWPAYIGSVHDHTEAPIAFDKFHSAQHLSAAVDQVRRSENRALRQQGDDRLAKTRYLWLTRPANQTLRQRRAFTPLRTSAFRVPRAWTIKELAMRLCHYRSRGWAERMWNRWYGWAHAVGWSVPHQNQAGVRCHRAL